ncbi:MAG: hypothetical protein ABJC04_01640 [Verrucomicrobiota bacterium]
MNAIWITSMILQWAMILVLSLLVLSLLRQLGERAMPVNTEKNPDDIFNPFSALRENSVTLMDGKKFKFGGNQNASSLIIFFSPKCGACEQLPEALRGFLKKIPSPETRILAVLKRIDRKSAEEFINEQSLHGLPIVLEEDFPAELNPAAAPYAAAIARNGTVAARGKPKILKQILEMAHAAQHMAHMVPDHSRRTHDWGESAPYWDAEQKSEVEPMLVSEPASTGVPA